MSTAVAKLESNLPVVQGPDEWPGKANAIEVSDQATYENAANALLEIAELEKKVHETFDPICQKAYEAHKEAVGQRKKHLDPLATARQVISPKLTRYTDEQERLRREEQRRLEAEQRAQQEKEQLEAAEAAQKSGASEAEVDAILDETPPPQPMPVAPARVQRVSGISTPERWSANVVNKVALLKWIVESKQFALADPNMAGLNAMARAQKQHLNIPGVEAVSNRGVRVGGR